MGPRLFPSGSGKISRATPRSASVSAQFPAVTLFCRIYPLCPPICFHALLCHSPFFSFGFCTSSSLRTAISLLRHPPLSFSFRTTPPLHPAISKRVSHGFHPFARALFLGACFASAKHHPMHSPPYGHYTTDAAQRRSHNGQNTTGPTQGTQTLPDGHRQTDSNQTSNGRHLTDITCRIPPNGNHSMNSA